MRLTDLRHLLATQVFLLALFCAATLGHTIYVDDDAAGANNGTSWTNAYRYLQDALADANGSEKPIEIRVAQGIYKPDQGTNQTSGDREATFQLINGVSLKGGYAGMGEPNPNARDIEAYETILSGDLDGNDIDVSRVWELREEPSRKENSCHVVTSSDVDESTALDGFTVTGGYSEYAEDGGGMYNIGSSPALANCTFSGNCASFGSGMYNKDGNPTLVNCTCAGNPAHENGGGMYNERSSPTLIDCTFSENLAIEGGGVHNYMSNPRLNNCILTANWAFHDGGGMSNRQSNPILAKCVFVENRSRDHDGAGIYNVNSNLILIDCIFSNNWAEIDGGGMLNFASNLMLINCTFHQNLAGEFSGGGLYNELSTLELNNCAFISNSAESGGAIFNYKECNAALNNCIFSGNYAIHGVAIVNSSSKLKITNCSFIGNKYPENDAWRYDDTYNLVCNTFQEYHSSTDVVNCIFWNGGREVFNHHGSTIRITYCDIQGGRAAVYDPCEGLVWGERNIDADPCFAHPGYWDDNGTPDMLGDDFWVDGDYHLKSQAGRWDPNAQTWVKDDVTSPCIDSGDPASPIGEEQFPNGGRINMGAYGGTAEASKSYFGEHLCETIIAGDINGDCIVDFTDFQIMASHWLSDNNP